jgi:hypothetical protein
MTRLADFLFPLPARRTTPAIVRWWEGRRLAYNALVGGAGLFTLATLTLFTALPPFSDPQLVPLGVVLAYGLMANVMYTFGWVIELAAETLFRRELLPVGPALYRMGLTFALGLTLLPAVLIVGIWIVAVLATLLGLG